MTVPATLWLTGLPASGKSTLASAMCRRLMERGLRALLLDGDGLRAGLCRDLGFSPEGRRENIRRAAEVCRMVNDSGVFAIAALVSPWAADRAMAAAIVGEHRFFEVYVATPLAVCEERDPKGLYRRARAGLLRDLTGVGALYEAPVAPGLVLDTARYALETCLARLENLIFPVSL